MTTDSNSFKVLIGLLLLWHTTSFAQGDSGVDVLEEGHWVEIRGSYQAGGKFLAQRIDLVQPEDNNVLIGTITGVPESGYFMLLGQRVKATEKARFSKVDKDALKGVRVKVEGHYRRKGQFSAREVTRRGEGRERIVGRIDSILRTQRGVEISVMGFGVQIAEQIRIRHDLPIGNYKRSESTAQAIVNRNRDDDDLFGKGIRLSDRVMFSGLAQARSSAEDEFDFDQNDPNDRNDFEVTLRTRLVFEANASLFAVVGLNHRQLNRDDEQSASRSISDTRLGETYLYWRNVFGSALDLQIGRLDFDDEREWLYDQNLDALRAIWIGQNLRAELSYSETLADGNLIDEAASNSMLYVSNNDDDRHLAGYVIHRNFDLLIPEQRTHVGLRAIGDWLPSQESWVDVAYMTGKTGVVDSRGWAFDIGSTWMIHERFALTFGYAVGQGNDPTSITDNSFRQSGLNDNNGKFSGVTSFRYYGELMDPELANLEVLTGGVGMRPSKHLSLDLIWHSYAQNELSTSLIEADINAVPNGLDTDLGKEIDIIFGWRSSEHWAIEVVGAWFVPGKAFDNVDNAIFGKIQLRYRF